MRWRGGFVLWNWEDGGGRGWLMFCFVKKGGGAGSLGWGVESFVCWSACAMAAGLCWVAAS